MNPPLSEQVKLLSKRLAITTEVLATEIHIRTKKTLPEARRTANWLIERRIEREVKR